MTYSPGRISYWTARNLDMAAQCLRTSASLLDEPSRDRDGDGYTPVEGCEAGDTGVLLSHPLGHGADDMEDYRQMFLEDGFNEAEVESISYPSNSPRVREGADYLHSFLEDWQEETGIEKVIVVGESLGAVIPQWLDMATDAEIIDRAVGFNGPNGGSVYNDWLRYTPFPHMEDLSLRSADRGVLSEMDSGNADAEHITVTGSYDGLLTPCNWDSAMLEGATNVVMQGGHGVMDTDDGRKLVREAVEQESIDGFIDEVEALDRVESIQ